MEAISKCFDGPGPGESHTTALIATSVVTTVTVLALARAALWPRKQQIIRGPLTTAVPRLSKAQLAEVPYTPDFFPGGRNVATPYGNTRVYEFGPEDGRKVLMIHGISTSCMTLKDIARPLAEKGCRVMLYDIFGRGYSDAPADVPYDTRLFITQILLVLASSPLSWTGSDGLNVIGYSLGGGIAASFAAAFPDMVQTLVLLAPAGLIRPGNIGRASRLVYTSGVIPDRILAWLTRWRLRQPIDNAVSKRRKVSSSSSTGTLAAPSKLAGGDGDKKEDFVADVAIEEAVDPAAAAATEPAAQPTPFEMDVMRFVHWTLDHHEGFVQAFMSTLRYAPLMDQHDDWRKLARRRPGTTAVLLGRHDNLVQREDYTEDALPLLGGEANVFWRVVPGAHNFPFTHGPDALERIYEFWGI
ncbi:alpha/beta-hydrolase [Xylariomycetidae sp. FL2044]|nr:alpha/beta-hydrolase [Xylariomycetidae sp. FL2044]